MHASPDHTVHDLKVWPDSFVAIVRDEKTCEVRLDDRQYAVGDILRLREYDPKTQTYSGRETARRVTHVLRGGAFGIDPRYVVLSLGRLTAAAAA